MLLRCPQCNSSFVTRSEYPSSNAVLISSCAQCSFYWFICNICQRATKNSNFCFSSRRKMLRHMNNHHVSTEASVQSENKASQMIHVTGRKSIPQESEDQEQYVNEFIHNEEIHEEQEIESRITEDLVKYNNLNESNLNMNNFFSCYSSNKGLDYLVSLCQFHSTSGIGVITKEEIDLHMNYSSLLMKTSRNERAQLVSVIEKIVNITLEQVQNEEIVKGKRELMFGNKYMNTTIPMSLTLARSMYLKGKYAMTEILPHPKVIMLDDGIHAYVPLNDIIQDAFGHGLDILNMNDLPIEDGQSYVRHVYQSFRSREIIRNAPKDAFVFMLLEWRDDAKGNRGMRNNGSLWIKTISFIGNNGKHSRYNTYPIAIGPKNINHEAVEHQFKLELQELKDHTKNNIVYSSVVGKDIRVYGDIFASIMDQPERRSSNSLMLGNGLYSSRWGYSCNLKELQLVLPPCSVCFRHAMINAHQGRYDIDQLTKKCQDCVFWDMNKKGSELLKCSGPKDLPPTTLFECSNNKISPFKLTYEILCEGVSSVFENVSSGKWTLIQAKSFMSVLCLSHNAQEEILAHAKNCHDFDLLCEKSHVYPRRYANIVEKRQNYPLLFLEWNVPSLWIRDIPMNRTSDAIMHLLFLGIEKSVNKEITKFLCYNEKHSSYCRLVKDTLKEILGMTIRDWCDILPYSDGHFANWISDNHLAMTRLSSWYYVSLKRVLINYVEPNIPINNWPKKDCKTWLKIRDLLRTEKLSLPELRNLVIFHKKQNVIPPIIDIHNLEKQRNVVMAMINAKTCMMYRIMSPVMNEDLVKDIDFFTKLFLSLYVKFDRLYDIRKKNASWVSASNFVCLLNLPSLIKEIGPLRNLWEGSDIGEKILGSVKDEFNGFRKNWNKSLLERIYKHITYDKLLRESVGNQIRPNHHSGHYHLYDSEVQVRMMVQNQKPLSMIQYIDNNFYVLLKNHYRIQVSINVSPQLSNEICGLIYFPCVLFERNKRQHEIIDSENVIHFCLLLPMLYTEDNNNDHYYCVITNDWKVLNEQNCFSFPVMSKYPLD